MREINKTLNFLGMAEDLKAQMFDDAEKMGLDFIYSKFDKEGFMDGSFQGWQDRKTAMSYKLLSVTGTLSNCIRAQKNET